MFVLRTYVRLVNISFRLRAAGVKRLGAKESVAIGYRPHAEQPKEVGDGRALRVRPVTRPRAGSYPLLRGRTLRLAIANIARETGLTRATAPRRFLHTLDKPRLRRLGVRRFTCGRGCCSLATRTCGA